MPWHEMPSRVKSYALHIISLKILIFQGKARKNLTPLSRKKALGSHFLGLFFTAIFYPDTADHLQEFSSGRELLQALQQDAYAKHLIAPAGGIKHSTFFDTVNERGVEQLFLCVH